MKRTRAATKAGEGPASAADDGNAKAASRRVKVKIEKQPKAPAKAKANPKPKAKAAAGVKATSKPVKQAVPRQPAGRAATASTPTQPKPAAVNVESSKAAAVDPPIAVVPKAVPAAERSEPKPAKAKSATASKAAVKAPTPGGKAKTATMPSKPATAAKAAASPGGKAATVKKATTPAKRNRVGVILPVPGEKTVPGSPRAVPANEELFVQYRQDGEQDVIGPEGVERLCSDLGLSPEDRKVLLLAWKTGAKRMGFFTRAEFRRGMDALGARSVASLKKALPTLEATVAASEAAALDFFQFAFRYCLVDGQKKFIETETAAQMLGVVLPDGPLTARFQAFLGEQTEYKVVSADQWLGIYRFSQEVKPNLSNFDESQAWPVLLDNFVDWARGSSAADAAGQ